jgi:hypothetical protein
LAHVERVAAVSPERRGNFRIGLNAIETDTRVVGTFQTLEEAV